MCRASVKFVVKIVRSLSSTIMLSDYNNTLVALLQSSPSLHRFSYVVNTVSAVSVGVVNDERAPVLLELRSNDTSHCINPQSKSCSATVDKPFKIRPLATFWMQRYKKRAAKKPPTAGCSDSVVGNIGANVNAPLLLFFDMTEDNTTSRV